MDADEVLEHMKACSPATLAELLRAREWPWKQQVLNRMTEPRRAKVLEQLRRSESPVLAPAVLIALCERLWLELDRLRSDRGNAAAPTSGAADAREEQTKAIPMALRRLIKWMR
jgi:hypothetical protein